MSKEAAIFLALGLLVVFVGAVDFIYSARGGKPCPDGYVEQDNHVCMKKEGTDESA